MGRRERLAAVVLGSLEEPVSAPALARRAYWSRTHFFRLFRQIVEETPAAMRRRLLLERAAWQLSRTDLSVTDIALEAQYNSLEAFTRAFRKSYGVSPSLFRRSGATQYQLASPGCLHFYAAASAGKGATDMDLFQLLAGGDSWHTRRMLERAVTLTDEQLDRRIPEGPQLTPWEPRDRSLRELLIRLVANKELWTAALAGGAMPEKKDDSPTSLLARLDAVDAKFMQIMDGVRMRGAWDDTFVDALCDPPETFTFGAMFGHLLTFNTYRRIAALHAFRSLGITDLGMGCPSEYEASLATTRA